MTKPHNRGGRGVLVILSLFLAASGALRLGDGIGSAFANSSGGTEAQVAPENCPKPPVALAEALRVRDAEATAREIRLSEREAALALAETAINARMAEMQAAETELRQTLRMADGAAEADLKRLTAVYEAMKPADAAKIFATMAPEFAAGFLGRMTPESAAQVLAGMAPDKAYAISALIAGRNALVPKT